MCHHKNKGDGSVITGLLGSPVVKALVLHPLNMGSCPLVGVTQRCDGYESTSSMKSTHSQTGINRWITMDTYQLTRNEIWNTVIVRWQIRLVLSAAVWQWSWCKQTVLCYHMECVSPVSVGSVSRVSTIASTYLVSLCSWGSSRFLAFMFPENEEEEKQIEGC